MLWAKAQGDSLMRRFTKLTYERFWKRELDVEDPAVVEALLLEAGADVAGFRADALGAGRARYDAMQRQIFEAGIFCVPGHVVDGEDHFRREHLPRIPWLLRGPRG